MFNNRIRVIFSTVLLASGLGRSVDFSSQALKDERCSHLFSSVSDGGRTVLQHFLRISQIFRRSGSEGAVRDHIVSLAKKNKFFTTVDEVGNLIIDVPGTGRFKNDKTSIGLQSHLDMVLSVPGLTDPSKMDSVFKNGVPNIEIDEDVVHTGGRSSLGADNGLGVAAMLRFITDKSIEHPRLKLIFTVEEETTFRGAFNLKLPDKLRGLINLDMEVLDEVAIGCQGSCRWIANYRLGLEKVDLSHRMVQLHIRGFQGGHSGMDIHKGRGNVTRLASEFLLELSERLASVRVNEFGAGQEGVYNQIANSARVDLSISRFEYPLLRNLVRNKIGEWRKVYGDGKKDIEIQMFERTPELNQIVVTKESLQDALSSFLSIPDGPLVADPTAPNGWDITSNQGYLTIKIGKQIGRMEFGVMTRGYNDNSIKSTVRSGIQQARNYPHKKIVKLIHHTPSWVPDKNSPLIGILKDAYAAEGLDDVSFISVAGGLETASLTHRFPEVPMISFGPDIFDVHSPHEKFSIRSLDKFVAILDKAVVLAGERLKTSPPD